MSKVSLYPNIKVSKDGSEVKMHDVMYAIQNGKWKDSVESFREKKYSEKGLTKEESEKIKSKFPYFTVSGLFSVRKIDGIIAHSGKLAIDFDLDPNPELLSKEKIEDTKKILCNDKYSEYVFYSCSGGGICVITNIDSEKHLESFLFLEKYYKECYGLVVDKSCKDITRARYISYDPGMFYNPNYEKVYLSVEPEYATTTVDSDEEKYEFAKKSHDKRFEFVEGQRHHYLVVLAYWCNKCGVSQQYVLNKFIESFVGNGKTEKEIIRIVGDCYKNTVDHGTFTINKKIADLPPEYSGKIKEIFAYAHSVNNEGRPWNDLDVKSQCEKGEVFIAKPIVENIFKTVFENNKDSFGIDKKPDIVKIEYFIGKRYNIAKNEITHRLEFKLVSEPDSKWDLLNIHTIYRDLQHAGIKFTFEKLKSLLQSDYIPLRNPIREYFDSLPEWDEREEEDYISKLASFIKTDNDEFWSTQFKKALVRNIACTLDYKENRIIMVLVEANQNTGKTSFIRFLCPNELAAYYTETTMDSGKDSDIQLSENMFWNLEELAALHNNDINKLKATISKSVVKQRAAYMPHAESNPRRVNFWASTNKSEFLTDDQNTRWLCFNVESISHDYNNKVTGVKLVNIDNVWAQAYTLYRAGFNYQLTKEESDMRDASNKNYELVSMEKDLIIANFVNMGTGKGNFMSYTEILIHLNTATDNKLKLNIHAVAKAMRQLGYINTSRKANGYSSKGFWCAPFVSNPILNNNTGEQSEILYTKPDEIGEPDNDLPL